MTGEVKFEKPVVVQQTETPVTPANSQKVVDTSLPEALSTSDENAEEVNNQTERPKLSQLDLNVFPKRDRNEVSRGINKILSDIEIAYNSYNSGSLNHISIDYTNFPDPNDYKKESKNDRCASYLNALDNWSAVQTHRLQDAQNIEQNKKYDSVMKALEQIYGAEIKSAEVVELIKKYCDGTIESLDELKEKVESIQSNVAKINRKVDLANSKLTVVDHRTADIEAEVELTQKAVLDIDQTTNEIKNNTDALIKNNEEEEQAKVLREDILVAAHNNESLVYTKLKKFMEQKGYRFDWLGNSYQAIQDMVNNLTLEELKQFRNMLKSPSDPLVH